MEKPAENTQNTEEFPWLEEIKENENTKEWKIRDLGNQNLHSFNVCTA